MSLEAIGIDRVPVIALEGEEEIGRSPRFEITFAGPEIDAAAVVGRAARLVAKGRVLGGVIAEIETGEALDDGNWLHRATLVPRAWLLSRGRQSRVFERLSAPEIIEVVVAASGLDVRVDSHLREQYPARACTVQHRESDLDFIVRLAERDGISLRVVDDGARCTIALSDRNDALPDAGEMPNASGIRRKTTLLPRRVELVSADPARPELPLSAVETVLAEGSGELQIHDVPFSTPEEGARAARLYADWLRSTATILHGHAPQPVAAGTRVRVAGRAALIVSVRHALLPDGTWISQFTAIPAQTPFRPERRAAAPRAFGLMGGRLSPRAPGAARLCDDEGRYRVRDAAGAAERLMPMAGGGAFERELGEGAQVVWGCLDGDPERPVITAVLPDSASPGRAVLRGPGGSLFEVGGAAIPGLGDVEGMLHRPEIPAVAHHSTTTEDNSTTTGTTDTWMRFAVPHTDKSWSYLRYGEAAINTSVSATSGETFTESSSKCLGLSLNSYSESGLAGVFDFTDKNRTELTKGDVEQVVKGEGRIAIHGGAGSPNYELRVKSDSAEQTINTPRFSFTNGTDMSAISGFSMQNVIGTKYESAIGGKLGLDVGFLGSVTVGYKMDLILADSFEVRKGEELSDASTIDKRASEKIQFSVHPGTGMAGWDTILGLGAMAVATGFGVGAEFADWSPTITSATLASGVLLSMAAARYYSKERDLTDGNPIMSLDKKKKIAAVRSDDWLLMMSPDWVVLGKNKAYYEETEVASLSNSDTEAGIIIEEPSTGNTPPTFTIQAGKDGATKWARIVLKEQAITIQADKITIDVASAAKAAIKITGDVEITGDVKVGGKLNVTGASTFADSITGPNGAIQVKK